MSATTIVIPAFNRLDLTMTCLDAVEKNTCAPYSLTVVDNGSDDGTSEYVSEKYPLAKVITLPTNLGFAQGSNAGGFSAETEFLTFLNNDTEVQPDWLEPHLYELLTEPDTAVAGSHLIYPDGRTQHAGVYFTVDGNALNGHHYLDNRGNQYVKAVTAACMTIRTDLFKAMGGFSTDYYNGNEDCDLCLKLVRYGKRIYYAANSEVIHHESQSGPERWAKVNENVTTFTQRWINQPSVWQET